MRSLRPSYLHKAQSKSKSTVATNQSFHSNSSNFDNMYTAGDISDQRASSKLITDASSAIHYSCHSPPLGAPPPPSPEQHAPKIG